MEQVTQYLNTHFLVHPEVDTQKLIGSIVSGLPASGATSKQIAQAVESLVKDEKKFVRKVATHAACDEKIRYDLLLHKNSKMTLGDMVKVLRQKMCEHYKWQATELKPGQYGYDTLAVSIWYLRDVKKCDVMSRVESSKVHDAWAANHKYWAIHKPYMTGPYYEPFNQLDHNDARVTTPYDKLDEVEKEKDDFIAEVIIKLMNETP